MISPRHTSDLVRPIRPSRGWRKISNLIMQRCLISWISRRSTFCVMTRALAPSPGGSGGGPGNEKGVTKELIAKTTLSHYRIVTKIGAGGMGEVYLAQDTKLDRKVALKILPPDVASNRDRMNRFVREAKSAAALNHPNIAHIYEIGEADGTHFIAMEFIDGVTLGETIHREGSEITRLLKFLQQVAEGLSKAHTAGIVHRDLKPDNIMITRDGYAKVLDFGLAKLVENSGAGLGQTEDSNAPTNVLQQHSVPGMVMGTVGYMSPEQAQGKISEIDQRSDIFSFGCILYEAVTGHRAFAGKDVIDSLNKIIREPVAPITDFRTDAPNHLQRIVRRCLAKDPEDRYQTIKDVAIELRDLRHELASEGGAGVKQPGGTRRIRKGDRSGRQTSGQALFLVLFEPDRPDPGPDTRRSAIQASDEETRSAAMSQKL